MTKAIVATIIFLSIIAISVSSVLTYELAIVDWEACIENTLNSMNRMDETEIRVSDMNYKLKLTSVLEEVDDHTYLNLLIYTFGFSPILLGAIVTGSRSVQFIFAMICFAYLYIHYPLNVSVENLHDCDRKVLGWYAPFLVMPFLFIFNSFIVLLIWGIKKGLDVKF